MKRFLIISTIFFLIFFTAFIKNSTKRIDDLIFSSEENLRALSKNFEKNSLNQNGQLLKSKFRNSYLMLIFN